MGAGFVESASILRKPSSLVNFLRVWISWPLVTLFSPYSSPSFGIFDIALMAPSMHLSVNSVSALYVMGLLLHTCAASAIFPSTMDTAFWRAAMTFSAPSVSDRLSFMSVSALVFASNIFVLKS